jgi:outer membrane receptor protein involved in Fe transport
MTRQELIETLTGNLNHEKTNTHEVGLKARFKDAHLNTVRFVMQSIKSIDFDGWEFSGIRKINKNQDDDVLIFKRK